MIISLVVKEFSVIIPNRNGAIQIIWPLTPKTDRATWAFLKFDMRHKGLVTCDRGYKL